MRAETPKARAIGTYYTDWPTSPLHHSGIAKVNPETLGNDTSPDCCFQYIDIGSVTQGSVEWKSVPLLRFADAPSRARRIVRAGDTVLCTVRPLLMSHAYLGSLNPGLTVCSTGFAVIRSEGGLKPNFLKHLPFSEPVSRQLVAWQCGTNYPAVNERDVRQLVVPVPPPDEQAEIANILDVVDVALEGTRTTLERARQFERTILEHAFDNLRAKWVQLRQFIADIRYGTSKATSDRGWGNPVLRIPNVISDRLSLDDLAFVELPSAEVERLLVNDGDLLLVRTNGNPNYVGRSAVFRRPDSRNWVFASYLIRVRLVDGLLPDFLNVYLGLEHGRREILRRVTTSAGNHNINSNSLRLLRLPVPINDEEQSRIVELAVALRRRTDALTAKVAALEVLKGSLMRELLTGRLRVSQISKVAAL